MANFMILLKKNLIEMVRNKRIIIFSLVFLLVSVISALTARFLPDILSLLVDSLQEAGLGELYIEKATVADSYVQFISNISEVCILLIILMFASTIVKEKSKGTYTTLKMSKVKDHEIVLSHFVAQVILVTISYVLSVAVFVLLNILLFRQIMGVRGLVVILYLYLTLLAMTGFTLFSSSISNKSGKAYLIVLLGYFGLGILEIFPKINQINPLHLLTISSELMYHESYSLKENLLTSLSSIVIIAIFVIASIFVVKNRINNRKAIVNETNNTTGI